MSEEDRNSRSRSRSRERNETHQNEAEAPVDHANNQGEQPVQDGSKLFVGNLSYDVSSDDLRQYFGQHGTVVDASIILDRATNRPRGFAFVTMSSATEADAALNALQETEFMGRTIRIDKSTPKGSRPRGERRDDRPDRRGGFEDKGRGGFEGRPRGGFDGRPRGGFDDKPRGFGGRDDFRGHDDRRGGFSDDRPRGGFHDDRPRGGFEERRGFEERGPRPHGGPDHRGPPPGDDRRGRFDGPPRGGFGGPSSHPPAYDGWGNETRGGSGSGWHGAAPVGREGYGNNNFGGRDDHGYGPPRDGRGAPHREGGAGSNVCYAFQKGNCTRGSSCRYSHNVAPGNF